MITRARCLLAGLALGVALAPLAAAHADSFEAQAEAAVPVKRLDDLVWALTAACDRGTEIEQRQCRLLRDRRAAQLAGTTLLVDGDPGALEVGTWHPQRKSLQLAVTSCIRCAGIEVDGKTWHLVGGSLPRIDRDRLHTSILHAATRTFPDAASAAAWTEAMKAVRVDYVVKLPPPPGPVARPARGKPPAPAPDRRRWQLGGKQGLAFDTVGFRVVTPCDGVVIAARPPAQPVPPDTQACTAAAPPPAAAAPPAGDAVEALTGTMIRMAMQPVLDAANACHARYGVDGRARLVLTVAGDGSVTSYEQEGDFKGSRTGTCIDAALPKVRFPRSQRPTTRIGFPIVLQ
jgi:hypothetical protein